MPYNTTPITPTQEITGTVSLPRELLLQISRGQVADLPSGSSKEDHTRRRGHWELLKQCRIRHSSSY